MTYAVFIFYYFLFIVVLTNSQYDNAVNLDKDVNNQLSYDNPSEVGLDSTYIYAKVDSIMIVGIQQKAFPGAQLLVAKQGKIIFHSAYGFHTYDSIQPVGLKDIYDLASVAKIAAGLPALMKLHGEDKFNLDKPFSHYWKSWQKIHDKKELTVREVFAHQAGLEPYIVFLNEVTKKSGKLKKRWVSDRSNSKYNNQAFENLFVKDRFKNKIYRKINASTVSDEKNITTQDLPFCFIPS